MSQDDLIDTLVFMVSGLTRAFVTYRRAVAEPTIKRQCAAVVGVRGARRAHRCRRVGTAFISGRWACGIHYNTVRGQRAATETEPQ